MKFYRYRWQHKLNRDLNEKVIVLDQFDLIKETPCGYWIDTKPKRRWVSKTSVSKFAHPTRLGAARDFRNKVKSRISFVRDFLENLKDIDSGLEQIPQSAELDGVIIQENQKLLQCK